ncbi:MAG: ferrous iron transport protein A [Clostridiales bacterium]|nr:ferrous iron transport protein A [Clostridiales bacterium]
MIENYMPLNRLQIGKKARVKRLLTVGGIRRRLQDIGLIEGTTVVCLHISPPGDPIAYWIRGAVIALRSNEAAQILVEGCDTCA